MLDLTAVFVNFPVLETQRFILRDVVPEDAPDLFRIMSNPHVTRYIGRAPMETLDEAVQRVNSYRATYQNEDGIAWAIVSRETGRVLGTCVFWNLNLAEYRAEIGYLLGAPWWGQGVMHEALTTIIAYGFTTMGLHTIEGHTVPENTASQRVLEKLGFARDGLYGEMWVFSLSKSAWENRI